VKDPGDMAAQPRPPELLQNQTGGRFPVPDPTTLTTEALRREVAALQVLIEQRIRALGELVDEKLRTLSTELDGRAQACVQAMEAIQDTIAANAAGEKSLMEEKFKKVEQQFELVENQRVEQKVDTKSAVDAALIAQKEAVREQTTASERAIAKSETATNKQLEQLAATFATAAESLRRSIDDVKERVGDVDKSIRQSLAEVDAKANRTASEKVGATESKTGTYATIGLIVAVVGIALVVLGVLAARGGP